MGLSDFTIDDSAPQVSYFPPTTTHDLSSGWSQFLVSSTSSVPIGATLHLTARAGAGFSFNFTGTAVQLFGASIPSAYTVSLDGSTDNINNATFFKDPPNGLLASLNDLSPTEHTLVLTNTNNSYLIFDKAVVSLPSGSPFTTEFVDVTQLHFTGSWSIIQNQTLLTEGSQSYYITQTAGDYAEYSFQGTSLRLLGLLNSTAGLYNISISSQPPSRPPLPTIQLSGYSTTMINTTLFYASGLPTNAVHTLRVINAENKTLAISGLEIEGSNVSTDPMTSGFAPSHLPRSTIIVTVVASVLGFLLISGLLIFLIWKTRRRKRREEQIRLNITPDDAPRVIDISGSAYESMLNKVEMQGTQRDSGYGRPDSLLSAEAGLRPPEMVVDRTRVGRPRQHSNLSVTLPGALIDKEPPDDFPVDVTLPTDSTRRYRLARNSTSTNGSPIIRVGKTKDRDLLFSFLDFASSAASSIRAASARTRSLSSQSNPSPGIQGAATPSSNSHAPSVQTPPQSAVATSYTLPVNEGIHSPSGSRRPHSRRLSLKLNLNASTLSPSPRNSSTNGPPASPRADATPTPDSPTESIPFTVSVSDIIFRVDGDFIEDDTATAANLNDGGDRRTRPPHPPLPSISGTDQEGYATPRPYISQRLVSRRLAQSRAQQQSGGGTVTGTGEPSPLLPAAERGQGQAPADHSNQPSRQTEHSRSPSRSLTRTNSRLLNFVSRRK